MCNLSNLNKPAVPQSKRVDLATLDGSTYVLLYIWAEEHGQVKTVEREQNEQEQTNNTSKRGKQ